MTSDGNRVVIYGVWLTPSSNQVAEIVPVQAPPSPLPIITMKEGPLSPERFGFRAGEQGTHSGRTIMLAELRGLFQDLPPEASLADYRAAVIDQNVLGKRTQSTRRETAQRLRTLYGLDPSVTVFRGMRFFWEQDPQGQPLLAMSCALTRDPLLRLSMDLILRIPEGEEVSKTQIEQVIAESTLNRFSPKTLSSIVRNVSSSWTQSGHLKGRSIKYRALPDVTAGSVAYAVLLGYLCGGRGRLLLDCVWVRLLGISAGQAQSYVSEASGRGWLDYRGIGSVVEIRFPTLLTPEEQRWVDEQARSSAAGV